MASLMRKGSLLNTSCGSPHYASPEVVLGSKYDGMMADIWSCGVILFALLTGKLPFDDDNIRRLLTKVKSGVFSMPHFLNKDVKDLIWRMLTVDPSNRISLNEIKEHPWFKSNQSSDMMDISSFPFESIPSPPIHMDTLDEEILRSLQSLGWGDPEEIKKALVDSTPNLQQSFYRLMMNRKLKPPNELFPSRPSRSFISGANQQLNRSRGSSAPQQQQQQQQQQQIHLFPSENQRNHLKSTDSQQGIKSGELPSRHGLDAHIMMDSSENLKSSSSQGKSSDTLASNENSIRNDEIQPTSITFSSTTTTTTTTNTTNTSTTVISGVSSALTGARVGGDFRVSSPLLVNPTRRNSGSSSPINILGASRRLNRVKLESEVSSSPIIGSSPKRSWFSNFFSKADKQKSPVIIDNLSTAERIFTYRTKKPSSQLHGDLLAALKKMNILYEISGDKIYYATYSNADMPNLLRFTAEIYSPGEDKMQIVNFALESGDVFIFGKVCHQVADYMNI